MEEISENLSSVEIQELRNQKNYFEKENKRLIFERKLESELVKNDVVKVNMVKMLIDTERLVLNENGDFTNLKEQLEEINREAPTFFRQGKEEKSQAITGSVGNFSRQSDTAFSNNPWSKRNFNLTKQGEIFKKDPALARKLMNSCK